MFVGSHGEPHPESDLAGCLVFILFFFGAVVVRGIQKTRLVLCVAMQRKGVGLSGGGGVRRFISTAVLVYVKFKMFMQL